MIVKGKPNTKKVIVKTEDGEVYKTFNGGEECANFLGITRASVYNRASFPHVFYKTNGIKLSFTCVKHIKDTKEEGETNDEIRRRLELNPYGEWRKEENILALIERCNKMMIEKGILDLDPEYRKMREKAKAQNIRWIRTQKLNESGEWFNVNVDTRNMEL